MSGATSPLPNTPSWRGVQLKHGDNFTFTFYLLIWCQSNVMWVSIINIKLAQFIKYLMSYVKQQVLTMWTRLKGSAVYVISQRMGC
jgi:hypothetical protein